MSRCAPRSENVRHSAARFRSAITDTSPAPPAYRCLLGREGGPGICFQRVPESKTVKNRVHLDIVVADVERATALIEDLGGRKRGEPSDFHEGGWRWRMMADPEGNEFCLVPRAGEVSDAPTL